MQGYESLWLDPGQLSLFVRPRQELHESNESPCPSPTHDGKISARIDKAIAFQPGKAETATPESSSHTSHLISPQGSTGKADKPRWFRDYAFWNRPAGRLDNVAETLYTHRKSPDANGSEMPAGGLAAPLPNTVRWPLPRF
jgi:hypothetical protein